MAAVARDLGLASEVGLIDDPYHQHHLACGLLKRGVVRILCPVTVGGFDVTIGAIQTQGGCKESHRPHELVDRNPPQHLDVLEYILCHLWFVGFGAGWLLAMSGLTASHGNAQYANDRRSYGKQATYPHFPSQFDDPAILAHGRCTRLDPSRCLCSLSETLEKPKPDLLDIRFARGALCGRELVSCRVVSRQS